MPDNPLLEKKTGIILVVTNEKHNLQMLYQSLFNQTYKNFILYFVDNNSNDGSVDYSKEINKDFGFEIKYILLKENSGDAKGNSIGASEALKDGCDYIFILNNDTELDPSCIEELIKLIEKDENTGVAGPIFFYWTKEKVKNEIQIYGAYVNFKTQDTEIAAERKIFEEINLPDSLECDYPIGGALFIKRKVIEKLGTLFDDRYFMYNNEIDFAYRLKALGYKSLATTKAKIWHNHKWVRNNKQSWYREYYLSERNKFLYYHKYRMYFQMLKLLTIDIIKFPWRLRWFIKVCDFKLGIWYLKGMLDGLLNKQGKPNFSFIKK
jgi:GT2 family glycosyltransferase